MERGRLGPYEGGGSMSAFQCVSGVLGLCWVGVGYPTQIERPFFAACRRVCWVCWVWRRVRACVTLFRSLKPHSNFPHARTHKPDKPNTPNTLLFNALFLKGFKCVGPVLGWLDCVLGSDFERKGP